jgi:broad specificity phosphatase PhoE
VRLFVLTRHAQTALNLERRVNGDPSVPVPLTPEGREQARRLGVQLAHVPLEAVVHTRFSRTRETAELAVEGRGLPAHAEPDLDDVDVGDLEGLPIDTYREYKNRLGRREPFPGGESLDAAARRYARGFARLLELPHRAVLVVCHEIPVRYTINAAAGSDTLDGPAYAIPNATPYLFDDDALVRAVDNIERLAPRE